ncbi:MAG: hypothetical protein ACQETM_10145, partial [Bacteroidota bacterium]
MNSHITFLLDEARRAPSVLNSQPWRFRVCGNTIEVYLDKKSELEQIDLKGRLQMASCGTLIAHLEHSIIEHGLQSRISYFPRFEEEDLVAFVEISGRAKKPVCRKSSQRIVQRDQDSGSVLDKWESKAMTDDDGATIEHIQSLASRKGIELLQHDDSADHKIHTYFRNNCGEKLKSEHFRKSLNFYLRSEGSDASIPFEDELLLSDRFFEATGVSTRADGSSSKMQNVFMILTTGTDNRYEWLRSGQALGDIIMELRKQGHAGLLALPIISNDDCREWLRKELKLPGYPQFV